jgi:hypothetical protein
MTWKAFNVAGVYAKDNPSETMRRIDKISKYSGHGSTFGLVRDPSNEYDFNAIEVRQYFKSGASIRIGYVPNNKKRGNLLADELAPLMDNGWEPVVRFGRKFIDEATCECRGLQLRYEVD